MVVKKLAEQTHIITGFMLQNNKDLHMDLGIVFQGGGEDEVCVFISKAVFFVFEFRGFEEGEFFFGKNELKDLESPFGV